MKKVFSILLVFSMVFMLFSGVTVFADDVIAGNDVIPRTSGPDTWKNFYLVDRNNGFEEDYIMTGFSAYVASFNSFKFMVFTENEDVWEIVYESELITPTVSGVYTEAIDPGCFVPAGSYVGLFYPGSGAVPYTVDDDEGDVDFISGDITRAVLFTNEDDSLEFVDFYNSGDRIYSIQALGTMAPETEWMTPIANENFKLNVKATLPVKFRLEGEFEEVKLMIGDVEVELDYKECVEDCNFYMGLFRPTESGEFTATVFADGVAVLTKDFVVFENMPKGNLKVTAKIEAKVEAKVKGNK